MISRIHLLIALAVGISSCKSFTGQEEKIISAANESLAEMQVYRLGEIESSISYMKETVEGNGNKPKDVKIVEEVDKVKSVSDEAIRGIILLEKKQANPDSVNLKLQFLSDQLKARLELYKIKEEKAKIKLPDLSSDPSEINLNTKKLQVLNLQDELVQILTSEIQSIDIRCDVLNILVAEASKVLEEGSIYYADVFPGVSLSGLGYENKVTFDDTTISYKGASAQIKYKPKAQVFDAEGLCKKNWSGTLTYKTRGRNNTIATKGEYWVRKCR